MFAIGFKCLAGSYHATPWGRHVNEADVEWPPSPWRIVRALIATWHRKADRNSFPLEQLSALVGKMSESLPLYRLPPAVHTHTRHYMPQFAVADTSLVFDAFAGVDDKSEIVAVWDSLDLDQSALSLLDHLLLNLGYLGRAESWVEARRIDDWQGSPNCSPAGSGIHTDVEAITLFAPLSVAAYQEARKKLLEQYDTKGSKGKMLRHTLPETLLEAVSLDTADWQKAGWSQPPSSQKVRYLRPEHALQPIRSKSRGKKPRPATTARLVLAGKPLPRIEDALRVGEWVRRATIGKAGRYLGENNVPKELSGHGLPDDNRHGHAFWLPEDADGDGHIDHVLIYAPDGLSHEAQLVIDSLRTIRGKDGLEWRVALEGVGNPVYFSDSSRLCREDRTWISITPWLHAWHVKKRFGLEEQLRRECRERGLPDIESVEWLNEISLCRDRVARPLDFHRFRTKSGLTQPDTHGLFVRLNFSQPICGPLALGFGCHFGLGLFTATD